ncbi:MAG: dockerin type I domain-containing protein, partial [Planctomycetota bacterium]
GADGAFTRFDTPLPGFYLWAVISSDLDGDGRPEALVTEALTGLATIMPNRSRPGLIEFGVPQPFSAGSFPWDVLSEDLDFDCDRDLVICDIAQHRVSWLLNLTPQAGCGALDLDGDGRVGTGDLLVVLREWGRGGGVGDVDRDGTVGPLDLLRMTARLEAIR